MQTPKDDNDDFHYTIASSAPLPPLERPPKRRLLMSEPGDLDSPPYATRSNAAPPLSPVDGKQFSVVSGILSPKSPQSPTKASLLLDDADTHYASSEVPEAHWQLTATLPVESPENFYKAIPPNVPDNVRVNQLFLWAAQYNKQKLASKHHRHKHQHTQNDNHHNNNSTSAEVERIVDEVQSRLIDQMVKGEIRPSSYKHHKKDNWSIGRKIPHPVNEKNRQRIAELQQMIQMLQNELLEWEQISVKLFSEHAATLDELPAPRDKTRHRVAVTEDMLEGLELHQKEFLQTYCKDHINGKGESTASLRNAVKDMDVDTTIIRQQLFVLDQFQAAAADYGEARVEEIVTKSKSKVPCPVKQHDERDPGVLLPDVLAEEEEERGKEAVIDILRVLGYGHHK